jgi:hypothetical protein
MIVWACSGAAEQIDTREARLFGQEDAVSGSALLPRLKSLTTRSVERAMYSTG